MRGDRLIQEIATTRAQIYNGDVIRPTDNAVKPAAGLRVLLGNLAPDGAIIKPSAASKHLLEHEGTACVFENIEDKIANIDRLYLPVDGNIVLIPKGCGPTGCPNLNMPTPQVLVEKGVRDMVRVSDGRMSGTAFGTVVLHARPESNAGGTLGLVKTGYRIRLSAEHGALELLVSDAELEERRKA